MLLSSSLSQSATTSQRVLTIYDRQSMEINDERAPESRFTRLISQELYMFFFRIFFSKVKGVPRGRDDRYVKHRESPGVGDAGSRSVKRSPSSSRRWSMAFACTPASPVHRPAKCLPVSPSFLFLFVGNIYSCDPGSTNLISLVSKIRVRSRPLPSTPPSPPSADGPGQSTPRTPGRISYRR